MLLPPELRDWIPENSAAVSFNLLLRDRPVFLAADRAGNLVYGKADSVPLDTGLSLPDEIRRREDRKAKLLEARKAIEERYEEVRK
jgi:hypothetical protein